MDFILGSIAVICIMAGIPLVANIWIDVATNYSRYKKYHKNP